MNSNIVGMFGSTIKCGKFGEFAKSECKLRVSYTKALARKCVVVKWVIESFACFPSSLIEWILRVLFCNLTIC